MNARHPRAFRRAKHNHRSPAATRSPRSPLAIPLLNRLTASPQTSPPISPRTSPPHSPRTSSAPAPSTSPTLTLALALAISFAISFATPAFAQTSPAEPTRKELLERNGIVWGTAAVWITPYAENISDELKLLGLARLWMEAKLNFPRFSTIPDLDWDRTYLDFIPRVRATKSTYEYYKVLQEMCALLQDGHSDIFLPKELAQRMEARPPLEIDVVEHRVFVGRVSSPSLQAAGITPGLEILRVDGVPVREAADHLRRPYVTSNSPAHRELSVYAGILDGPAATPASVELRSPRGQVFTKSIPRSGSTDVVARPPVESRHLPGNLIWVGLNTFNDESVRTEFERLLPELRAARGIILDIRANEGGSGVLAYDLLAWLTGSDFAIPRWRTRQYAATLRVWGTPGGWLDQKKEDAVWKGHPEGFVSAPVVLLTGPRSLSASDVFAAAFRMMHRGLLVGEPTGGSTGDPLAFAIPGGGSGRVSTSTDAGEELIGIGVVPDLLVPRTVKDFLAGHDAAMDAAVASLTQRGR